MFVTLDFETFYRQGMGLTNLTTEEYINHPEFHEIGLGLKIDYEAVEWIVGHDAIAARLAKIDWSQAAVLCHNTLFDGAILAWRFGVVPQFYFDTLCMARAIHGVEAGGSLAALASRYKLGVKGTEVVNALGKRLEDFTPAELARYGDYCKNDVEITLALFGKLATNFPTNEFDLIDMTIRMFTCPTLYVDDALLVERLETVREEKRGLLGGLMQELSCEDEEGVRMKLSSNQQFAAILERRGVSVPMKISPATGKETFALAKNDEGFIALQEHEDPTVQQLCAVRLGTKSTLEESRIERFIGTGARNKGKLPIPLKYYGAHTGRWSGSDKVNFQNLPSRDKKKKSLKNSIVAPPGHVIIDCDSSQIEARVLAWWAGQDDVVQAFANKQDIYCQDASKVYGRTITKDDPVERFVGKTMRLGLGYGTGAAKLQHTLKTTPPGADPSLEECKQWVNTWRMANSYITDLWRECDQALNYMMGGSTKPISLGLHGIVTVSAEGVRLPNGLYIRYDKLRRDGDKVIYDSRKGPQNIWGGAMVENIVQALARIIVGQQMLWIQRQYRVVLTVHDAAMCVVPEEDLTNALEYVILCMSTTPPWAQGLPIACEAKHGTSYGNCK